MNVIGCEEDKRIFSEEAEENKAADARNKVAGLAGAEADCENAKRNKERRLRRIERRKKLEAVCGKKLSQACDSKCWSTDAWEKFNNNHIKFTCGAAANYRAWKEKDRGNSK